MVDQSNRSRHQKVFLLPTGRRVIGIELLDLAKSIVNMYAFKQWCEINLNIVVVKDVELFISIGYTFDC